MTNLFIFGLGFAALAIARHAQDKGWSVAGTIRNADKAPLYEDTGIDVADFTGGDLLKGVADLLAKADHLLISIPPDDAGDPVVGGFDRYLKMGGRHPKRITYLSSLSVYGDFKGAWIDEEAATKPNSKRGKLRLKAEASWQDIGRHHEIPLDILRLAGIYGPGRNMLQRLEAGTAKRITGTGHVFNRIHVDDIAAITIALMQRPAGESRVFNVCDNEPAAQEEVILYAAKLLGTDPPPTNSLDEAGLSPLGRSFFEENKKVRNSRVLTETGITLAYPTYREGLTGIAINQAPQL